MNAIICDAIAGRVLLEFYHDGGTRLVEPYVHGQNHAGNDVLRAYQVSGYSSSGESEGWKIFRLDRMSALQPQDEIFHQDRALYNPDDRDMATIYCRA